MAEYTWPVTVIHKVWCSSCDRLEETDEMAAEFGGMQAEVIEVSANSPDNR